MSPLHNDRWIARFTPQAMGRYLYTVRAWVDHLATWKRDLAKKQAAGQDVTIDLLARRAASRGEGLDEEIVLQHEPPLTIEVDRERARFSTWYELFPRSTSTTAGKHGTFKDVEARLPLHRVDVFRRAVSAADPPDRRHRAQRPEQHTRRERRRRRQPVGHRRRSRRAQGDPPRARHARRFPPPRQPPRRITASRSHWTSPSRRAPIIRT